MKNLVTNFYGRTKGKALSAYKEGLIEDLLPVLKYDLDKFNALKGKYKKFVLDIGFGQGESTFFGARDNKDTLYVGIELFVNGYANLLGLIDGHKKETGELLENILIVPSDAVRFIEGLESDLFDRVQLLFPDPWHKKRHNKRRFVSEVNLKQIKRVLKQNGVFRFVSDIDDYNFWTLMMVSKVDGYSIGYKNLQSYEKEPLGWAKTKYQKKAVREGRRPLFFDFNVVK